MVHLLLVSWGSDWVYNVDTVITSQKQGNWYALWQDQQKALFVAHGRVQALVLT